jgi:hypothetical protein
MSSWIAGSSSTTSMVAAIENPFEIGPWRYYEINVTTL